MKKIIFTIGIALITVMSYSQTSISCSGVTTCQYDKYAEKYNSDCTEDGSASCLFVFNEKETMFKHITSSMTSTYYITTDIETDTNGDGEEVLIFTAVSDVGNTYLFILCIEGKYVNILKDEEFKHSWQIKAVF